MRGFLIRGVDIMENINELNDLIKKQASIANKRLARISKSGELWKSFDYAEYYSDYFGKAAGTTKKGFSTKKIINYSDAANQLSKINKFLSSDVNLLKLKHYEKIDPETGKTYGKIEAEKKTWKDYMGRLRSSGILNYIGSDGAYIIAHGVSTQKKKEDLREFAERAVKLYAKNDEYIVDHLANNQFIKFSKKYKNTMRKYKPIVKKGRNKK